MLKIGDFIADIIEDFDGNKDRVLSEVTELCAKFPIY